MKQEKKELRHIQLEKEILDFWEKEKSFEQSVEMRSKENQYVFYDGPPFATGLPHYGHIVGSIIKDAIPRYQTMKGYRVERVWGWDCHGLPIENIVEKKFGFQQKKDILSYGVDRFNEACRETVLEYVEEWERVIKRLGRWVDMEHAYKTMDLSYMESIWWVFKELYQKKLVYEGKRSIHICPRCETTLSQQEVSEGYKEIRDLSVIAMFALAQEKDTYILAWTTTPWTLIGNVALAVSADVQYVTLVCDEKKYILAESRVADLFSNKEYTITDRYSGKQLAGKSYIPLYDYYAKDNSLENHSHGWKVYSADFVSDVDGTGVVHIAPAFGEDDMQLGKKEQLPFIQHVGMDGVIEEKATDFAGMHVKQIDDHTKTDIEIIKSLAHQERLFHKEKYLHSYPHCWRCDTPLLNYVTTSWYVNVTAIKEKAITLSQDIHWSPEHIKEGRFGKWLEGARDWSISRQRFWGSVIPLWRCACGAEKVFGSVSDLEKASGEKITDIHSHIVDAITVPCESCDKTMRRIPDVLDTWFDSGSMPYAQMHYPFENKETFENNFPAKFIGEGIDQTRAWFYYLHILATAIQDSPSFENVIVNGVVLAEDGKKMSKRLKNYPDPMDIVEKYGADSLRLYLAQSPVVLAETVNFSEKDVQEVYKKYTNTLLNIFALYELFAEKGENITLISEISEVDHVMDRWILSRLHHYMKIVSEGYAEYDLRKASKPLIDFVQECSTWYVRRSRDRVKDGSAKDIQDVLRTVYTILYRLAQISAPVTPFISEYIYRALRRVDEPSSVHHTNWPSFDQSFIDETVTEKMQQVREIIEQALSERAAHQMKVRQPLASMTIVSDQFDSAYEEIMCEELNIKKILYGDLFSLDTTITKELQLEGLLREATRKTNAYRKECGLTIHDRVNATICTDSPLLQEMLQVHGSEYAQSIIAQQIEFVSTPQEQEMNIDGEVMSIHFDTI